MVRRHRLYIALSLMNTSGVSMASLGLPLDVTCSWRGGGEQRKRGRGREQSIENACQHSSSLREHFDRPSLHTIITRTTRHTSSSRGGGGINSPTPSGAPGIPSGCPRTAARFAPLVPSCFPAGGTQRKGVTHMRTHRGCQNTI